MESHSPVALLTYSSSSDPVVEAEKSTLDYREYMKLIMQQENSHGYIQSALPKYIRLISSKKILIFLFK